MASFKESEEIREQPNVSVKSKAQRDDLDPVPQLDNADPYNWPQWKKMTNFIFVIFHASMATFSAAAIVPAFQQISDDLHVSLQTVSYLTTIQIIFLAFGPLVWKPFASVYGRRPLFLLSLIGSLISNVGCANSTTYGAMCFCRALVGFFLGPAAAIGSAVVTEVFSKKNRALYMGLWTLMMTLGVPLAPLTMGFVSERLDYRWIYWILAIANGVHFVAYIFLGSETRYIPGSIAQHKSSFREKYLSFSRIDTRPLSVHDFLRPLGLSRRVCVVLPGLAHAVTFMFGNTLVVVELPALFGKKFAFNSEQLGLQFIGLIVGSVLGEQGGGSFSDYWMRRRSRRLGTNVAPEYRLWISYLGFVFTIVGLVVFLVRTEQVPEGQWNVSPVIGIAIAGAGNQMVTTVLITYAIDCYPDESASIGVIITLIRQTLAFVGPFWFTPMFNNVGVSSCSGIVAGMIVALSIVPIGILHWQEFKWREGTKAHAVDQESANS